VVKKEFTVKNATGFHARPASKIVDIATKYKASVNFVKESDEYNCKSMMSILSMGAKKEDRLTLVVDGEDEETAIEEIMQTISSFI
jgi:phosphocarrier protein